MRSATKSRRSNMSRNEDENGESSVVIKRNFNYVKDVQRQELPFYKQLSENVQKAMETTVEKEAICILHEELHTSNEHFRPYLQQALLDSNFMVKSASIAEKRLKDLETSVLKFDLDTFATRLKAKHRKSAADQESECKVAELPIDFEKIGGEYGNFIQSVPSFHFMFGAFDADDFIKEQRNKRAIVNFKKEDAKKPKVWSNKDSSESEEEEGEDESTAESVNRFYTKLCKSYKSNKKKPVNFFELVCDESSFSATVENIFRSSFLAKGGYAKFTVDAGDNEQKIEPVRRQEGDNDDEPSSSQAIITFTKEDWFKWIEKY